MDQHVLKRNHVTILGQGTQPMLLANGLGCDQHMWRYVTPAFEQSHRIILFDYVGSGKSDRAAFDPIRYNQLTGYAQDVLDICETLDLTNVVFIGHSISAMIGLLAAIEQPHRFAHLIMIAPSARYLNDKPDYIGGFDQSDIDEMLDMMDQNYMRWATTLAPSVMANPGKPELSQELAQSFTATDWLMMRQFARITFLSDNRLALPKLHVPSLILQSSQDIVAPQQVGEYIHQHLPGSTLRYMKATGHYPHLSAATETVDLVKQYLSIIHPN
ncbi:sigma factor SigB/phosphatase RsbP regulator RsbQ [Spirosoma migulaei]